MLLQKQTKEKAQKKEKERQDTTPKKNLIIKKWKWELTYTFLLKDSYFISNSDFLSLIRT